jgi:hypothetical protein
MADDTFFSLYVNRSMITFLKVNSFLNLFMTDQTFFTGNFIPQDMALSAI